MFRNGYSSSLQSETAKQLSMYFNSVPRTQDANKNKTSRNVADATHRSTNGRLLMYTTGSSRRLIHRARRR